MKFLVFIVNCVIFSVPAGLAALGSAKLAKSSRDEWQVFAWIPTAPLALWGLFIIWGVTRDPTSHNLWPFELVFWTALTLILFAAFLGLRRLNSRPSNDWRARQERERERRRVRVVSSAVVEARTFEGQRGDEAERIDLARVAVDTLAVPSLLTRRQKAVVLLVGVLSVAVLVLVARKRQ
jgi:hypothetical protein